MGPEFALMGTCEHVVKCNGAYICFASPSELEAIRDSNRRVKLFTWGQLRGRPEKDVLSDYEMVKRARIIQPFIDKYKNSDSAHTLAMINYAKADTEFVFEVYAAQEKQKEFERQIYERLREYDISNL